jgi:hypothetical protein
VEILNPKYMVIYHKNTLCYFILTNCNSRYSNCIESPDYGHTRPKHVGNIMLNKSKLVHLLVYLY